MGGAILPVPGEAMATLNLLKHFPDVAVYGLLLSADPKHPLSQLMRERWEEYHRVTGDKFWFVAFQPPAQWTEFLKDYWKQKLGNSFEGVWQSWQSGRGFEHAAYDYLALFDEPKIKPSQLPCLVLFTDPGERRAVVRSLPKWDTESLHELLMFVIFENILQCCEQRAKEERLECLRRSLSVPSVALSYVQKKTERFLKENPAVIFKTAISWILALQKYSVLPIVLGPTAEGILRFVKDVFFNK